MRTRTERFLPFALLLPTIAFLTLLIVIPMVQALLLSVIAESGGLTLDNFQRMFADVNFSEAWRNTLLLSFQQPADWLTGLAPARSSKEA